MRDVLLFLFGKKLNKPITKHIAQTKLMHFRGVNVGRMNGKVMI